MRCLSTSSRPTQTRTAPGGSLVTTKRRGKALAGEATEVATAEERAGAKLALALAEAIAGLYPSRDLIALAPSASAARLAMQRVCSRHRPSVAVSVEVVR